MSKENLTYQVGPDANRVQAFLTRKGRQTVGYETAKDMDPVSVRQAAVKHLTKKTLALAGATVAFAGGAVGAGELVGYSIDHSSTTEYQQHLVEKQTHDKAAADAQLRQYQHDSQTAAELNQQLPPDPNTHIK